MIDFHTHPVMIKELIDSDPELDRNIHSKFGFHFPPQPLECFTLEMDEAGIDQAVLLPIDVTTAHGCKIVSNEQIADLVEREPRFIGFASVDPNLPEAPAQLERAIRQLGLRGLKLDPSFQCFYPNDQERAYPVYQTCAELGIPVLMHAGLSWVPSGLAKFSQPLNLEEAVQAFPTVNFILAHFAWPWVNEAVMLAVKYPNVYLDTAILYSGTPKNTFQKILAEQVGLDVLERSLFNKIVFGSNYPRVDIRRTVRGISALEISKSLAKAIFDGNARRLLNMEAVV
ncbi:MAG: amidohydrolase family protein [Chloroflexi bacterium]|nr:amidohydrolase family protein [Chloroflexota bacterium]